jgi:hypothetical protein
MFSIFSKREQALHNWIVNLVLSIQFSKSIRAATGAVLKAFFQKSILVIVLASLAYSCLVVYIFAHAGFWNVSMLKDTSFWFIGSALAILFNLTKARKEDRFFQGILVDNVKLVLIIEFVANFHVFNLAIELIMLPTIVFFAMIRGYSEMKQAHTQVRKLMDGIFIIIGVIFLIVSLIDILQNIRSFASYTTLKSFLLPIILSISFIPCAFLIAIVMEYELLFVRLGMFLTDKENLAFAKRRIVLKGLISLRRLRILSDKINQLYNESTKEDIKRVIS